MTLAVRGAAGVRLWLFSDHDWRALLTSGRFRECDGPYGFVQAIREQIKNGVDHIKLNLTGGIMGPSWDRHWQSFSWPRNCRAAFAICHQRGYKVMAHAANPEAVRRARPRCAHHWHGYIMDEECIALFLSTMPGMCRPWPSAT